MSNLSSDQFGSEPFGYATPKDKNGHSVYPTTKATFDSTQSMRIDSPEHFAKVVKGKTGSRYDDESGTFKRTKIERWHLIKPQGNDVHYPAGYDGPVS